MASRKGKPNKMSGTVKENLVAVFTRLGGTSAMAEWAEENTTEFYKLYAKMLPRAIEGEITHNIADDITAQMTAAKERAARARLQ